MKKKIIGIIIVGIVAFTTFHVGMVAGAASATPGSTQDPLISQSYLEKRLSEIGTQSQSITASYRKVSVTKGKELIVEEGSEFVLYSGEGSVIGDKGIMNLSVGSLESQGSSTELYQNYLSLSSESGIKATVSCIIYVKGNYTIKG